MSSDKNPHKLDISNAENETPEWFHITFRNWVDEKVQECPIFAVVAQKARAQGKNRLEALDAYIDLMRDLLNQALVKQADNLRLKGIPDAMDSDGNLIDFKTSS